MLAPAAVWEKIGLCNRIIPNGGNTKGGRSDEALICGAHWKTGERLEPRIVANLRSFRKNPVTPDPHPSLLHWEEKAPGTSIRLRPAKYVCLGEAATFADGGGSHAEAEEVRRGPRHTFFFGTD